MNLAATQFRRMVAAGALELPGIGEGSTAARWDALAQIARTTELSVARLAEAHVDALAILDEAGCDPDPGVAYGVWASESPSDPLVFDATARTLRGTKQFCGGAGIVDRALVSCETSTGEHTLVDVAVGGDRVTIRPTTWASPGLAATNTTAVSFHDQPAETVTDRHRWYLERVGFWHGACGPAACWAGGALGVADVALAETHADPHREAQAGAIAAAAWSLGALLRAAGDEIDERLDDVSAAERRARALRFTVERTCTDVLDRFGRAFGPRPHLADEAVSHRALDLFIYLRQHHGERELPALAAVARRHR